jgi:hypothetical protein
MLPVGDTHVVDAPIRRYVLPGQLNSTADANGAEHLDKIASSQSHGIATLPPLALFDCVISSLVVRMSGLVPGNPQHTRRLDAA